jgi:hypothetical protein
MTSATMRLIEAVERLEMTGVIGDGRVAQLHDLAAAARIEVTPDVPDDWAAMGKFPGILPLIEVTGRYTWAERVLRYARNAHDCSTFGGRSRISDAQRELSKARAEYQALLG